MREKILDGLLKRREGVSMQDIIRVVNHQLFSIYAKPFTAEDEQKIQGFLNFLSQFEGMPQMDWVRDFCSHFDVFLTSNDAPVVEFEESDSILGLF